MERMGMATAMTAVIRVMVAPPEGLPFSRRLRRRCERCSDAVCGGGGGVVGVRSGACDAGDAGGGDTGGGGSDAGDGGGGAIDRGDSESGRGSAAAGVGGGGGSGSGAAAVMAAMEDG